MIGWKQFGFQVWINNLNTRVNKPQQTVMPKQQMMTYNITPKNPSTIYPWLEKEEEDYIIKGVESLNVTWVKKKAIEEDAYKTFLEAKQARAFLNERATTRKSTLAQTTWEDKWRADAVSKESLFVDIIREDALSKWIKNITNIDDDTLLERAFKQNPESQQLFQDFMNNKITTSKLADIITWKKWVDDDSELRQEWNKLKEEKPWIAKLYSTSLWEWNLLKRMWNLASGNTEQDDEWWFQLWKEEREKDFWDISLWDMWAFPSLVAWAVSAPLKAWATLVDLWWWLFGADLELNEWIDKLLDKSWISKDWWFNAWEIAWEIWMSAIAVAWLLNKVSKVWQLWKLISDYPKIAKYIARPVLEWLGYQGMSDLWDKELSTKGQYATSAVLSTVMTWLWSLLWKSKEALKDPKKYFQAAAKNVKSNFLENTIKQTDEFVANPKAINPLNKVQDKVDDVVNKIASDKWVVWEKLWKMRTQMKTISYSTDDIVSELNTSLRGNNIWADIIKDKKWLYKLSTKISKTSWKRADLQDIVDSLNEAMSKKLWFKNKLSALDKVNQDIIALLKRSNKWSPVSNALWKSSSKFTQYIDEVMDGYGTTKWEYGKLANIQTTAKELASDAWEKWVARLRKVFWPEWWADYKKFLEQVRELWYTTDDLLSETILTNYIMAAKLWKDSFTQAVDTFYPSIPWLYELALKTVKWVLVNPSKQLLRFAKDYKPWIRSQIWAWVSEAIKPAVIKAKSDIK